MFVQLRAMLASTGEGVRLVYSSDVAGKLTEETLTGTRVPDSCENGSMRVHSGEKGG